MTTTPTKQPTQPAPDAPVSLPHEGDESRGEINPEPQPEMEQARRDIESGQVDTDLRQTPGIDAEQRERHVGGQDPKPKRP